MRADLRATADLVQPGSRVLDLGCGDGELLAHLIRHRGCSGTGVDTDPPSLTAAIRRGVSVLELDMDSQLGEFADDSYDVVLLSQTLQAVRRPVQVLREIGRIAGAGVVSVPNFGLWRLRLKLLTQGRMPVSEELPHPWFETPNIHLATLADLEALFAEESFVVRRRTLLDARGHARRTRGPANLMASGAAYLVTRG